MTTSTHLRRWLRQAFCAHNSRETLRQPESGLGWTGFRTRTHCLNCGKRDVGP